MKIYRMRVTYMIEEEDVIDILADSEEEALDMVDEEVPYGAEDVQVHHATCLGDYVDPRQMRLFNIGMSKARPS